MTNQTKAIDDGMNSVILDASAVDHRHQANALAALIASTVTGFEVKLSLTAKDYQRAVLNSVYTDKSADLLTVIKDSKLAAGFKTLGTSEAGAKAKGRLNVYFSNLREAGEGWTDYTDDQRKALLEGTVSLSTFIGEQRKARAVAAKEAAKSETEVAPVAVSLSDMVAALASMFEAASRDERDAAMPSIVAFFDSVDADAKSEIEAGRAVEAEPAAIAA